MIMYDVVCMCMIKVYHGSVSKCMRLYDESVSSVYQSVSDSMTKVCLECMKVYENV